MKRLNPIPPIILTLLLLSCLAAFYYTRDSGTRRAAKKAATLEERAVVNEGLLATAQTVAAEAETSEEQDQARIAQHLADQELDQAFASALREAAGYRPPTTGPLRDMVARVDQLKTAVATDQERVSQLTKQGGDPLELAQAQLALDQDELEDARQDLAREGGDPHVSIERALQDHEASQHHAQQDLKTPTPSPTGTFSEQIRTWFTLNNRFQQLTEAERQALNQETALSDRHKSLEPEAASKRPAVDGSEGPDTTSRIATLRQLSDQRKMLTELDKRIQDCRQLASTYKVWAGLVDTRRSAVLHLMFGSLAQILAILLAVLVLNLALNRAFRQSDKKRLHQMRIMARIALQVVALGLILLIIFGRPNQISTIIGLTTAGLTLALKDFVVSFFGWFALMGKNGISVGDWVEIEGVGGEVIEIGLLKTVLLELGNWTDTGHPTGRQVAFANSFAIEKHYFNFSTSGQWLWDEIQVTLPTSADPYLIAQEIRQLIGRETDADAKQAEQDWERVTKRYGARTFSAQPAVVLRPSINGLEVMVRYITRAPDRNRVKSRLFELIVELLHKPVDSSTIQAAATALTPAGSRSPKNVE
jgi:small-conductance mechanosensitive channel